MFKSVIFVQTVKLKYYESGLKSTLAPKNWHKHKMLYSMQCFPLFFKATQLQSVPLIHASFIDSDQSMCKENAVNSLKR